MRPPILQWKVSLGLLAIVIAGVSLGSALHSTPPRTFYTYATITPQSGGRTSYPSQGRIQPIRIPANIPPQMQREMCASFKAEIPRREWLSSCHKRR